MTYGIIFWSNLSNSNKIFLLQKKVLRIMAVTQKRESYRKSFKKLHILPLAREYFLALIT
jgi:hypothetical protein